MPGTRTSYEGPIGGPAKSAATSIGWTLRLRRQSCATLSARRCGTRCGATPRSVGQSPRTGALSILKTALRFAVDAGYNISPVDRLPSELVGGVESSRDRVLTDEELRRLWQARSAHMPLLRFLILSGQRIGEAQRARSSHVHDDRWHIPKEHSKNHRAHWVALPRQALALLRGQDTSRALLFGTATDSGVQAWLRRWCERERISPAFRPHDLRRTCATRLNTLGVLPHVTEKALNHTRQGVMAVYNRADYEVERVEAMQRWADELDRILGHSAEVGEAQGITHELPSGPGNSARRTAGRLNP